MFFLVLATLAAAVAVAAMVSTDNLSQFGAPPTGDRLERIKQSPQFGNKRFVNPVATRLNQRPQSLFTMMSRWMFGGETRKPEFDIPVQTLTPASFVNPPEGGVRVTWIGHSSLLVELDGKKILTDPVWAKRTSPSQLTGPARFFAPPIALKDLPPLDAVVISHDHYDHLDKNAVRTLAETGVRFIMPLGVGAHLEKWGISPAQITELDWWEEASLGEGFKLVATPARHFSGRGPGSMNSTLWSTFVFAGPEHKVFFCGDTGPFDGFSQIGEKYGPFDVTLMKIGAYSELWPDVHVTPEQTVEAHKALGGDLLIPIHWGTFTLAFHDWFEPPQRLLKAVDGQDDIRVAIPRPGQMVNPQNSPQVERWWLGEGGS